MNEPVRSLFYEFGQTVVGYLPELFAGLVLIAAGWFLGWFLKRIVIRLLIALRFDRVLRRTRWGSGLSSADVRHAMYNFIGNIVFAVILLVFLNSAVSVMNLTILSNLLEKGILFLPRVTTAALIFGIGWLIAAWVAGAVQRALLKENVTRATLVSRFSRAVLLLFFSTMALTELDIAREIVIIGFTTIIITLGLVALLFVVRQKEDLFDAVLGSKEEE